VAFNGAEGYSSFSVSDNGTMVILRGNGGMRQLTWFDREGKTIAQIGPPGDYSNLVLSPDGKKVAIQRRVDSNFDIWVMDLERGLPVRFTFSASNEDDPAWSPDGSVILFSSDKDGGVRRLYRKAAGGAGNEELVSEAVRLNDDGIDWSPDGKNVIYETTGEKGSLDLWVLPMTGGAKPYPLLQSEFAESFARFSPDGRFFAYVSTESGRAEVYVQSFPPAGGKWQVSTSGGGQPHWRRDGKELYYISPDKRLMAVTVSLDGTFESGKPTQLFSTQITGFLSPDRYDVSADGQRFLVNSAVEEASDTPINVVLNWTSTLKK
jgi:Tol biopolymer transport system component